MNMDDAGHQEDAGAGAEPGAGSVAGAGDVIEPSEFDIAIIGAAGRFPGSPDLAAYWDNLDNGRECITEFSEEALLASGLPASLVQDPAYVKAAPVLDEPGRFDAAFFGYSPRDAMLIDPQQRLLLELAWLAFEDAGIVPGNAELRAATFAGTAMNTYLLSTGLAGRFYEDYLPVLLGSDKDFQATRVAFKLGLTGPAVTVQSACSTSLVAVHLACQSLINRESDLALATAAAIRCPPTSGHLYEPNSVFTPDGHCRPFDDDAAGTIFGSGGGAVLLKRLSDALDDGDPVRAVIKGSAINNDGDNKADYTAPTVHMQAEAISEALGSADVPADTVSYVEAHGTGTFLGDPIEVAALTRAFRGDTERTGFCGLGSVKSNIGHLDAAAGMAALLKVLLSMEHARLPPTLHFRKPNAQIDFAATPFRVIASAEDWQPAAGAPRRAGITSLGMGGTNAHVVVEEAPVRRVSTTATDRPRTERPVTDRPVTERPCLLPLSARDDTALAHRATDLADFLSPTGARTASTPRDISIADVAHTLQNGRRDFARRRVAIAHDVASAAERLRTPDRLRVVGNRLRPKTRDVVMMFPGQGAQQVDMGRRLYEREPVFRDAVDRVAEVLREPLDLDLRDVLFSGRADDRTELIDETWLTQPALFAIEHAYLAQWRAWGIEPVACIGHSIGEYVAAVAAGVFSLEDGARLVATRGRLMQSAERGSMLAVQAPEAEVKARLPDTLDIAVINAADACVVAGDDAAIDAFAATLASNPAGEAASDRGSSPGSSLGSNPDSNPAGGTVRTTRLRTSHAFHSRMMEPVVAEFEAAVAAVERQAPTLPFVSNTSGAWITPEEAVDPAYWAGHIRLAVRFDSGLSTLLGHGDVVALEAGPGATLTTLFNQHPALGEDQMAFASAPPRKSDLDDDEALHVALGQLWCSGLAVNWPSHDATPARRVALPGYRFGGKNHWFEAASSRPSPETGIGVGAAAGAGTVTGAGAGAAIGAGPASAAAASGASAAVPARESDPARWVRSESWSLIGAERLRESAPRAQSDGASRIVLLTEAAPDDTLRSALPDAAVHRPGDARTAEGYRAFADRLEADGAPARIVYDWRACSSAEDAFLDLVHLVRALARWDGVRDVALDVVTEGALDVIGQGVSDADGALALGVTEVASKEWPHVRTRLIDLGTVAPSTDGRATAERAADDAAGAPASGARELLRAALGLQGDETVLGMADGRLWSRSSVVAPLAELAEADLDPAHAEVPADDAPADDASARVAFADDAQAEDAQIEDGADRSGAAATTCVLVGGFGGIGRHLALRLASAGVALVLTHRPESPAGDREAFVAELEALGVSVQAVALQADDVVAARSLFEQTTARGSLAAVYHLGGHNDDGLLSSKSDDALRRVLSAKLDTTRALAEALTDIPGTAPLVLFSSVAAWSAPVGQVDYAAANAWQMAFARQAGSSAHRVVAIAWPGWQATGMVTRIGDERARQLAHDHGVPPGQALAVLDAIVASGRDASWVSPLPLSVLERSAPAASGHADGRGGASLSATGGAAAESARASAGGASQDGAAGAGADISVEARVTEHWKNLLGFDDIGRDENYFDIGGTSLVAVKLCGRLEREFDVTLAVEELIGAPTIGELASLIESRLPDASPAIVAVASPGAVSPSTESDTSASGTTAAVAGGATAPSTPSPPAGKASTPRPPAVSDKVSPHSDQASTGVPGRSSLVPLFANAGEPGKAPVFLIHAHGGMVIGYHRFAREIARHRAVYGLQSRGVRGDEPPLDRIEPMAARYAREIIGQWPEGPYVIGGYCMGGTIAWELARQLEAEGHVVALVFMLQSFHRDLEYPIVQGGRTAYPSHVQRRRKLELYKDKAVEAVVRHYRGSDGIVDAVSGTLAGSWRRLRKTLGRTGDKSARTPPAGAGLNTADNPALLAVHRANGEAFYAYDAGELRSPVAFYPAEHQPRHVANDVTLGWSDLAKGRVSVRPAPGSFLIGLDGLGLAEVADAIDEDIEAALAASADSPGAATDARSADVREV